MHDEEAEFFIIGALKCGMTSLMTWLAELSNAIVDFKENLNSSSACPTRRQNRGNKGQGGTEDHPRSASYRILFTKRQRLSVEEAFRREIELHGCSF